MKKTLLKLCSIIGILCCFVIFWIKFMRQSDFKWTVEQPQYWNSVIEIAILFWIYYCILSIKSNKNIRVLILSICFFTVAFVHSFIWVLLIGVLYFIFVYHLGNVFNKLLKWSNEFHFNIITGFMIIVIMVAFLSVLKIGTPVMLRKIIPAIALITIILDFKTLFKNANNVKKIINQNEKLLEHKLNIIFETLIFVVFSIIIGKANYCTDYDSLWYGLRSEYVLAPFTGIYDKVNMVGCVYVYPKAFETFSLVFSGLNSYGYFVALNICFLIVTLISLVDIGKELKIQGKSKLLVIMLVLLTPSITNMVTTAKPDVCSLYFQIVAVYFVIKGINDKGGSYIWMAICTLIMTFVIKPTSIAYSSVLILIVIVYKISNKIHFEKKGYLYGFIPFIAVGSMFARTILLTGLPMTSLVVSLFTKLGFNIKYPYTLASSRVTTVRELLHGDMLWQRICRLPKLFLYPNTADLATTERTWWGILFSVLWIIALIVAILKIKNIICKQNWKTPEGVIIISFFVISIISGGTMLLLDCPDGNYYILMQTLTYLYLVVALEKYINVEIITIFSPLILGNILLSIAISCSWGVGFLPVNVSNYGYYNHEEQYKTPTLNNMGLMDLAVYLEKDEKKRSLCFSSREDEILLLPGIIELFNHQATWANYSLQSETALHKFCSSTNMSYILIEDGFLDTNTQLADIIADMIQDKYIVKDRKINSFTIYLCQ